MNYPATSVVLKKEKFMGQTLPATHAQKALWVSFLINPTSASFNLPYIFRLSGEINFNALSVSWDKTVEQYYSLRTFFSGSPGKIKQHILSSLKGTMEYRELSENESQNYFAAMGSQPFDLRDPPLFLAKLIKYEKSSYYLFFNFHHILVDAKSVSRILTTLSRHYHALVSNKFFIDDNTRNLSMDEYLCWEDQYNKKTWELANHYWRQNLSDYPGIKLLNTDQKGNKGGKLHFNLGKKLSSQVFELSKTQRSSLFSIFTSVWFFTLYYHTGESDLTIGYASGKRPHEIKEFSGLLAQYIPLRIKLSVNMSINEIASKIKTHHKNIAKFRYFPASEILKIYRESVRNHKEKLFNFAISDAQYTMRKFTLKDSEVVSLPVGYTDNQFDLLFRYDVLSEDIKMSIEYSENFSGDNVQKMADFIRGMIRISTVDYKNPLKDILCSVPGFPFKISGKKQSLHPRSAIDLFNFVVKKRPDKLSIAPSVRVVVT